MAKFTVRKGQRYEARVQLDWWQSWVGNERVAKEFREAGFAQVKAEGQGRLRRVEGLWPHEDASAEIPPQVIPGSIREIQQVAGRQ